MTAYGLVVTTIGDGAFLDHYAKAIADEGLTDAVDVIVIPDRKTPASLYEACERMRAQGISVDCPGMDEQAAYLGALGEIERIIPFDSDNRRNVGYLKAIEQSYDVLISIDDDNYCRSDDVFFAGHSVVAEDVRTEQVVSSKTGWFNCCELLQIDRTEPVFPRGFPYAAREREAARAVESADVDVAINAGMWLEEPDLDALTWLVSPCRATSFRGDSFVLAPDTWMPVNTQNTAVTRDAVVAYYFIPMGFNLQGMRIDRYGDIFSGYFAQACVRHLGGAVRTGTPVVDHIRNRHDYMYDATKELACIALLEDLLPWLREVRLEGNTYAEAYLTLAMALDDVVETFSGSTWDDDARAFIHEVTRCMRIWVGAARSVGAR